MIREGSLTRSTIAVAFIVMLATVPLGEALLAESDRGEVASYVRSVLEDPRFQTEWPTGGEVNREGREFGRFGRWRSSDGRPLEEGGGPAEAAEGGGSGGAALGLPLGAALIFKASFIVLVLVLAGTLAFALASALMRRQRLRTHVGALDEAADSSGRRRVPDADLEELLRAGFFAEAAHMLLQRALSRIEERSGRRWARSLTSREILRRGALEGEDREALRTLVEAVERSLFGGLALTREDYELCAAAFARFGGAGGTA